MIKEKKMAKDLGKIIQIVGVVVDVEFPRDVELPAIYDALHVKNGDENLVLEVAQHLDEHTVRAIARVKPRRFTALLQSFPSNQTRRRFWKLELRLST